MTRLLFAALFCLGTAAPLMADAQLARLVDLLRINEVTGIMRTEGLSYADDLDRDILAGQGGGLWAAQVEGIYDLPRMTETVRAALEAGLAPDQIAAAIGFFETEAAQQIITFENASRSAMQDDDVEAAALESCAQPSDADAAHLDLVAAFTDVNDLIERNVAGALSSNFQFYAGLLDGRAVDMTESDILRDVYEQEPDIRSETESWLCGFLLLSYRPLRVETLAAYVAFYETPAGRALNAALFEGYEAMYRDISYALGRAVALNSSGDDI